MDLRKISLEVWRWIELAHDLIQWRALLLFVLNLRKASS